MTVTSICLQLKEHKQKATLDAVSKVLEIAPKLVLSGKPNNYLYSWIVERNDSKHSVSGTQDPELDKDEKPVIDDKDELEQWLEAPENQSGADEEFVYLLENMATK